MLSFSVSFQQEAVQRKNFPPPGCQGHQSCPAQPKAHWSAAHDSFQGPGLPSTPDRATPGCSCTDHWHGICKAHSQVTQEQLSIYWAEVRGMSDDAADTRANATLLRPSNPPHPPGGLRAPAFGLPQHGIPDTLVELHPLRVLQQVQETQEFASQALQTASRCGTLSTGSPARGDAAGREVSSILAVIDVHQTRTALYHKLS